MANLVSIILKNSTELAAALEAIAGGYILEDIEAGQIRFTCLETEGERITKAIERVRPLFI